MSLNISKDFSFKLFLLVGSGVLCALMMSSYLFQYSISKKVEAGKVARVTFESPVTFVGPDGGVVVTKGEVLARAGTVVTPEAAQKFDAIADSLRPTYYARTVGGTVVLCITVFFVLYFFAIKRFQNFAPTKGDLILFSLNLIGGFALLQLFQAVGSSLYFTYPWLRPEFLMLLAPFAASGMLIQVTMGTIGVILYAVSFSFLGATFLDEGWLLPAIILLGTLLGSVLIADCHKRSAFLTTGFWVGVLNVIICLAFCLTHPEKSIPEMTTLCLFSFAGGLASGVVALGFTPVAELVGSYVTDIKLLELASMDRELLRELSLQAPGTWNHSVLVGQLGEAGAEAIGVNGALLRVAAYYHDIGKMKKPNYFTENQTGSENKHDKLTPSMSALIIKAHVKDGVEMGKQHRLPSILIDLIQQHHGTSLIEYFYDRAVKEASEEETVIEEAYRYPGPKPQTKEAGVLMLADSIEAASRSMPNPTPTKIQGLVQKMINKVFSSGELDESGLTLRDLHLVAKEFVRVLSSVHHRRVSYPDETEQDSKVQKLETADANRNSSQNKEGSSSGKDQKSGRSNIRRLGLNK